MAFRRNTPSTEVAFEIEKAPRTGSEWQGTEEVRLFTGTEATRQAIDKVWGFSDGQQVYILHRNRYYPLRKTGNNFVFAGRSTADQAAVGTAGFVGGLAGSTIAAVATAGHKQEYTLDIVTGRISDYAYQDLASQHDTATIMVYRRPSSAKNVVKIFLDGQEAGSLAANSFAQIPWTNKTREVGLCLEENNSGCYSFIPDFTITNYVEVRAKTDAEQPVLLAAPQKEGDFYTKKMRRRYP